MEELKPCPFCGGKPRKVSQYEIYCIACTECAGQSGFYKRLNSAIDAWNTRKENT